MQRVDTLSYQTKVVRRNSAFKFLLFWFDLLNDLRKRLNGDKCTVGRENHEAILSRLRQMTE